MRQNTLGVNDNEDECVPLFMHMHTLRLHTMHKSMPGKQYVKLLSLQTNVAVLRVEMVSGKGRSEMNNTSYHAYVYRLWDFV